MIKIFNSDDRDFSTLGNICINPISCIETKLKSLNGWFLKIEVPIKFKSYILKDKLVVIKTKSKLNPQAFTIDDIEYTSKTIVFTANHVMFTAKDYFLLDVRPTKLDGINALTYINDRTDKESPFRVYSDVTTISTNYFIRKNLLEAWETIEEKIGGYFDADNWNISLLTKIGNDNGEVISYKKNLESLKVFEDWSNVCTKIYPVGKDGLLLPEKFLESDIQYDRPYTITESFETELDEDEQTEENLITELRNKALAFLENNKYPNVSYEIVSNINQRLEIGDLIHVKHPLIELLTEVQEYEYNHNTNRIIKLVFGNYVRSVKSKFNSIKEKIVLANDKISKQSEIIDAQTKIINSMVSYGKIVQTKNELLILDELPIENAKNVWRWNLGGLGFSSNGYEGPFKYALTQDGSFNADFISAGKINTNLIEGYDELVARVQNILEFIISGETDKGSLALNKISESEPLYIRIKPINENISYLYPHDNLFPSDDLFLKNRKIRFENTTTKEIFDYELPDDLLIYNKEIYDEFILDYENKQCQVIKKVGYNADGTTHALSEPKINNYNYPSINLSAGDYNVYLLGYDEAYLFVKLMASNAYTNNFATKVELRSSITLTNESIKSEVSRIEKNFNNEVSNLNSTITQTAESINSEVLKKVGNNEIISKINQSAEKILINADKISLEGKEINLTSDNTTIESDNFKVTKDGLITALGGTIGGWHITDHSLWCEIVPPNDYTQSDLERIQQICENKITPTSNDYEKYDFNKDGKIGIDDMLVCRKLIYYNLKKSSPGKLILDTSNCFMPIRIVNSDNNLLSAFGVNGIYTKELE